MVNFVAVAMLTVALSDGGHYLYGPRAMDRADCVQSAVEQGYPALQPRDSGVRIYCVPIDRFTKEQAADSSLITADLLREEDLVPPPKIDP